MLLQVNLKGGLGNQLFQIFTLLAFQRQYGLSPVGSLHGAPMLDRIGRPRPTYWTTLFDELHPMLTNIRLESNGGSVITYREPSFDYTPIPNEIAAASTTADVLLDGYFQSYKYFDGYRTVIMDLLGIAQKRNLLQFPKVDAPDDDENTAATAAAVRISMHFRRGDYLQFPGMYPILPKTYYMAALRMLLESLWWTNNNISVTVYYFCEQECEEEVYGLTREIATDLAAISSSSSAANIPSYIKFIKVPDTVPDWQQLLLMSACDHHIIANSSFSWFGAYLCNNYGGGGSSGGGDATKHHFVFYPDPWFGPEFKNGTCRDLCPKYWIPINY